ncbi:MAG: adenosylcobinamide-phosphate synthase CbiB [Candidatus Ornithomonoglobus sp.]
MWIIYSCCGLALGFILDMLIGDPQWLYHPIRLIGKLISVSEKSLRKRFSDTQEGERAAGTVMVIFVCAVTFLTAAAVSAAAYMINAYLYIAVEGIMSYFLLAAKSLKDESMKVYKALQKNDIEGARYAVSMIVGRDTSALNKNGIIKAAVETVAENTSDGVVAPLIFTAIGGAPLGFLYKAVNTMDSMVGYKNDKYINFGRAAARLDDFVNFLPSRASALLMIAASFILRLDYKSAAKVFSRDRLKHASPNSAQTEAVCAGALDVRLAGDAVYFGKVYKKDFIGDDIRPIENEDIARANRLMYLTSFFTLIIAAASKLGIFLLLT